MKATEISLEFQRNADGTGKQLFKQLRRSGRVLLYERRKLDGTLFGYEVFVVNSESFPLPNGSRGEVRETYPTGNSFGKTAWFCTTLERAEVRFAELVAKQSQPKEETPSG